MLARRRALALIGSTVLAGSLPAGIALAAPPTDRRLVVIVLRGGLDGLAAVIPYGDRDYSSQRGGLAFGGPAEEEEVHDLNGFFGFHTDLRSLHGMYRTGELAAFHAVATPYRRRSHFDAQDLLENGTASPGGARDGWLNRALAFYGPRDYRLGLSVGNSVPLLLRGDTPVGSFAPRSLKQAGKDYLDRVSDLYRRDPILGPAFAEAIRAQEMSDEILGTEMAAGRKRLKRADALPALARDVGKLMLHPTGARVAVLGVSGWDTHANQGVLTGQLSRSLKGLDAGLQAFKSTMAPVWDRTVVLVVSEFGRTVRPNGTNGTDHGVGGVAILAGGAVDGGRVVADWPGLASQRLFEGRDLAPTLDLRSVGKAVAIDHLGLPEDEVSQRVFPGSGGVAALPNLFRV